MVFAHSNGGRLSPQAAKQPASSTPCTLGSAGGCPFGRSSSEGQFGTEEYFKLPSTFRAVTILFFVEVSGGFGSHGLHLALNWWLIPVVSMETGIGRDKYREL